MFSAGLLSRPADWRSSPATPLAVFALLGPSVPVLSQRGIVMAFLIAAIAAVLMHRRRWQRWPMSWPGPMALAAAAAVAWGGLTALWALAPGYALIQTGQYLWALLTLCLLLPVVQALRDDERRVIGPALAIGIVAALALLLADMSADLALQRLVRGDRAPPGSIFLYNKPLVVLAILVWPVVLSLWQSGRAWVGAAVLGVVVVVALPLESQTAVLGLTCGLAVAGILALTRGAGLRVILVALVLGAFAMPVIVKTMSQWGWQAAEWLPASARHRVFIWDFVAQRIAEKPLLGWGLEASRVMPNFGVTAPFGYENAIPLHPHNAFLQFWLEQGIPGLVLAVLVMALPLLAIGKLRGAARTLCGAAWAADIGITLTGYGAGQSWLLTTILAQGLLCVAVLHKAETRPS